MAVPAIVDKDEFEVIQMSVLARENFDTSRFQKRTLQAQRLSHRNRSGTKTKNLAAITTENFTLDASLAIEPQTLM
jgi:hypothetical protein